MQISLLSLFSSGSEAPAEGVQASNILGAEGAPQTEGAEGFNQLFEGKLAEIMPEGSQELPAPKLLAAFLQRLHLIVPEEEAALQIAQATLPELSTEQIAAMAQVLGINPETLSLNAADSAEQIFPQGEGMQHPAVTALLGVLRELADLGQKMHQQGLTLLDATTTLETEDADSKNQVISLLALLSNGDAQAEIQQLPLSEESITFLGQLFGLPEGEIEQNIRQLQLIPTQEVRAILLRNLEITGDDEQDLAQLELKAKAPGLLQLLARILNQPVEEVWQKLEELTDGEFDLPLGVVFASIVKENRPDTTLDLTMSQAAAGQGKGLAEQIAGPALAETPKLPEAASLAARSGRKVLTPGSVAGATTPIEENAPLIKATPSLPEVPEEAVLPPKAPRLPGQAEVAEKTTRPGPVFAAATRESVSRNTNAAAIRQNAVQPLLRESAERPVTERVALESSSTLALTASDSKLDFDARLRESRSIAAREQASPNQVREQVAVQVKKGIANGDTRISVRLHPAELGRVDVRVEVANDGRTTLAIVADNRDTLDMLQRDSRSLEKAFSDLGLEMSDSGMSFDLNEQSAGEHSEERGGETANKQGRSRFDALLGNADDMVAEALLDSPQMTYMVGVDDGLNIKV